MSTILIGITGSIAAYKAIEIAKLLIAEHYDINIVLSKSASNFLSTLTLKSLFPSKVFLADAHLSNKDKMLHIDLARQSDLILIAPASANFIANLAHGFAPCLLTSLCLATKSQIVLAPAMNMVIWQNRAVQANIKKLKKNGLIVIEPAAGKQACGDIGVGRMQAPAAIVDYVKNINVVKNQILKGKKVVVTAGPTQERIDPVRFISNYSSGKMGYAVATAAQVLGAKVVLISGPTHLSIPQCIEFVAVNSAQEMLQASRSCAKDADIFIATAAVADYRPKIVVNEKIKRTASSMIIEFEQNPDIVKEIKSLFPNVFCLGFAAETKNHLEYGSQKLASKGLDAIAINDVANNKVFNQEENELTVIAKDGKEFTIIKTIKLAAAFELLYGLFK